MGVKVIFHSEWHGCQPVGVAVELRLGQEPGGPLGQRSGSVGLRGLEQWLFTTSPEAFRFWNSLCSRMGMQPPPRSLLL